MQQQHSPKKFPHSSHTNSYLLWPINNQYNHSRSRYVSQHIATLLHNKSAHLTTTKTKTNIITHITHSSYQLLNYLSHLCGLTLHSFHQPYSTKSQQLSTQISTPFIIFNDNNNNYNSNFQYLWKSATQNHFYYTTILLLICSVLFFLRPNLKKETSNINQTTWKVSITC